MQKISKARVSLFPALFKAYNPHERRLEDQPPIAASVKGPDSRASSGLGLVVRLELIVQPSQDAAATITSLQLFSWRGSSGKRGAGSFLSHLQLFPFFFPKLFPWKNSQPRPRQVRGGGRRVGRAAHVRAQRHAQTLRVSTAAYSRFSLSLAEKTKSQRSFSRTKGFKRTHRRGRDPSVMKFLHFFIKFIPNGERVAGTSPGDTHRTGASARAAPRCACCADRAPLSRWPTARASPLSPPVGVPRGSLFCICGAGLLEPLREYLLYLFQFLCRSVGGTADVLPRAADERDGALVRRAAAGRAARAPAARKRGKRGGRKEHFFSKIPNENFFQ